MADKYDCIIIGGGIAGLYSAYKIRNNNPNATVLVLERNDLSGIGGRAGNVTFQGSTVVTGAGIGRKEKDTLLLHLMDELQIQYNEFPVQPHYASTIQPECNIKKTFNRLKKEYNKINDRNKTFDEYATAILGKDGYKQFTTCSGYTDYEKEDAYGTLNQYGFDDNFAEWTGVSINWKKLVDELVKRIGVKNIHMRANVKQILQTPSPSGNALRSTNEFSVSIENGESLSCKKVIIATTISSVIKLLPGNKIYTQIHSQPFLRLYGKFAKSSIPIAKKYIPTSLIVPGPIQKVIPMDPEKGIFMIAYSDNRGAEVLKKYTKNTPKNREILCRLLERSLGIDNKSESLELNAILDFYWEEGTHYYEPLSGEFGATRKEFIKNAQHPMPNMLVVGEMISTHQGWVEGALESVENVVTNKWING